MIRKFGLIGYPLTHSFSKKYFAEKFQLEHINDAVYELFELEKIADLKGLIAANSNLLGINVTIPYKESVVAFCDALDENARQVGAVNCLKIEFNTTEKRKMTGFNTDVIGFEKSLLPLLEPQHQNALVLGSGGSSKAVQFVLQKLHIDFKIVSRTAQASQLRYDDLNKNLLDDHLLIVNTTPLGMFPNISSKPPLPYQRLSEKHLLFDLIYNPTETKFLQEGKKQGAAIKNGLEMLQIQAEASWKIWNNLPLDF